MGATSYTYPGGAINSTETVTHTYTTTETAQNIDTLVQSATETLGLAGTTLSKSLIVTGGTQADQLSMTQTDDTTQNENASDTLNETGYTKTGAWAATETANDTQTQYETSNDTLGSGGAISSGAVRGPHDRHLPGHDDAEPAAPRRSTIPTARRSSSRRTPRTPCSARPSPTRRARRSHWELAAVTAPEAIVSPSSRATR